jgi:hypothetical protein
MKDYFLNVFILLQTHSPFCKMVLPGCAEKRTGHKKEAARLADCSQFYNTPIDSFR